MVWNGPSERLPACEVVRVRAVPWELRNKAEDMKVHTVKCEAVVGWGADFNKMQSDLWPSSDWGSLEQKDK